MHSTDDEISQSDKKIFAFVLTAAMQVSFLSRYISKELLGYDFTSHSDRKAFISKLVSTLFDGIEKEQGENSCE